MKQKSVSVKYLLTAFAWLSSSVMLSLSGLVIHPKPASAFDKGMVHAEYSNDRVIKVTQTFGVPGVLDGGGTFRFENALGDYTYAGTGKGSDKYIASSYSDASTNYWQYDTIQQKIGDRFHINMDSMKRYESGGQGGSGVCRSEIWVDSANPTRGFGIFNPSDKATGGVCYIMRFVSAQDAAKDQGVSNAIGEIELGGADKVATVPDEGEWRDTTTIKFNNAYYRDGDIFDKDNSYQGETNGSCSSTIKVNNANKLNEAHITYRKPTNTSPCEEIVNKDISLKNTDLGQVNSYTHGSGDDQVVFLPQYIDYGGLKYVTDDWNDQGHLKTMGFFKQKPKDDSSHRDNIFWQWAGGTNFQQSKLCDDVPFIWVDLRTSEHKTGAQTSECKNVNTNRIYGLRAGGDPPEDVYGKVDWDKATVAGANGNPGGSSAGSPGQDADKPPPSCQTNNPLDLSWWACGLLNLIDGGLEAVTNALTSLLTVSAEDFSKSKELFTVWSYFRAMASFLMVAIALIMIIGQALGGE